MHGEAFLADLAIIMIVAGLVTIVFHRLRQPVVLGYIIAGLIVGPYTPPFKLVNEGRLIAHLDQSWDRSRSMRAHLAKAVPPLQKRAQETHRILVELLTREKLQIASAKAA